MAKTMAVIERGIVKNIIWCRDNVVETESLVDVKGRSVGIGDTYTDKKFYRDENEVLTPMEDQLKSVTSERDSLLQALAQMVEEVYESDTELAKME